MHLQANTACDVHEHPVSIFYFIIKKQAETMSKHSGSSVSNYCIHSLLQVYFILWTNIHLIPVDLTAF